MESLLPEQFEQSLPVGQRDVFDMVANWALANKPGDELDFELLFTGVDHIAHLGVSDPLALAFVAARQERVGRFQFKQGAHAGSYIEANFEGYRKDAAALAEGFKEVVHEQLSRIDPAQAAKLYHAFLALLSESVGTRAQIDVFTTNYDRAVEAGYEHEGQSTVRFELVKGFKRQGRARAPRFDPTDYQSTSSDGLTVRLYKLHGSLDWRREGETVVEVAADEYVGRNAVIYPLRKPSLDEPFKTLFALFEQRMAKADVCIVVGSSLRDEHIRRVLFERAKAKRLQIVLVDPRASQLLAGFEGEIGQAEAVEYVQQANVGFGGSGDEEAEVKGKIQLAVAKVRFDPPRI